ncbi:MAG TPA: lysophospholipid acyltransferase family protein [Candidatus Humimicrobiaceae bacterium]
MLKTRHSKSYLVLHKAIQLFLKAIFITLFRVQTIDLFKVPRKGKLIICPNHIGYLDAVLVGAFIPRCIYFMAKKELYNNKILGPLITFLNAFPVNRQSFDRKAFRTSFEVLNAGNAMGLFPEGTRSMDGILREGRKGIGFIAVESRAPILPIALSGTNKIIQKPHKRIFFPKIKLIVGDIIDVNDIVKSHDKKGAINIILDKTMEEINKLYKKIK